MALSDRKNSTCDTYVTHHVISYLCRQVIFFLNRPMRQVRFGLEQLITSKIRIQEAATSSQRTDVTDNTFHNNYVISRQKIDLC